MRSSRRLLPLDLPHMPLLRRKLAHGHVEVERVALLAHRPGDQIDDRPGAEHDDQGEDRLPAELAVDAGVRHQLVHGEQGEHRVGPGWVAVRVNRHRPASVLAVPFLIAVAYLMTWS